MKTSTHSHAGEPPRERPGRCATRRTRYSAWLDAEAELSPELESHLATCGDCRSFVEFVRATSRSLECSAPSTPGAGPEATWSAIARALTDTPRRRRSLPPSLARAAAALVGFVSILGIARNIDRSRAPAAAAAADGARLAHAVHTLIHQRSQVSDALTFENAPPVRAVHFTEHRSSR